MEKLLQSWAHDIFLTLRQATIGQQHTVERLLWDAQSRKLFYPGSQNGVLTLFKEVVRPATLRWP